MHAVDHSRLFLRSERFEPLRQLGAGGFGTVYEVYDAELRTNVALKVLHRVDADSVLRFKSEFRQLCELEHPALVRLYELFKSDAGWYFTMELVHGVPFLHDMAPPPEDGDTITASLAAPEGGFNETRTRGLFLELARGVDVLHRQGKLHRDLKPSNALVTPDDRVVLVDFGLVQDIAGDDAQSTVLGTPLYMSPEQMRGQTLSPASDWYSFGVMLYSALTRRRPFGGSFSAVASDKLSVAPVPVTRLNASAPADLAELTMRLLATAPDERPGFEDIARVLDAGSSLHRSARTARAIELVGRDKERDAIVEAFRAVRPSLPSAVHISGVSGVGKSALARWASDHLLELFPDAVVLSGRAFEHELVPFKAFDSLIDSLAEWLEGLPLVEQHAILPRRLEALASLFPAFARVPAVRSSPRSREVVAGAALRAIAGKALRELLARLADRRPLVLILDDVQWGDDDSERLLRELVTDDPPGILWLVCARDNTWRDTGPLAEAARDKSLSLAHLDVQPLSERDAAELARRLGGVDEARQADDVARASEGIPFFIERLSHWSGAAGKGGLPALIERQLSALSLVQRQIVQVSALAGRPIALEVALRAAGAPDDARWDLLIDAGLVQLSSFGGDRRISPAHDRIREAAAAALDEDTRREIHVAIARELIDLENPPTDQIARHLLAGGDRASALDWTERAADEALASFAFERASELFGLLLEEEGADEARRSRWTIGHAGALARTGRGAESAHAYLAAAELLDDPDRELELQQRATEQLLVSGHYDEGIELARRALAPGGVRVSTWMPAALASIARQQLALSLRGRGFEPRAEEDCDPRKLRQIDMCWSMVLGLMMIEPVQCGDFAARHMRLALELGEPHRVARGFVIDATFSMALGRGAEQSGRIWGEALRMIRDQGDPYLEGITPLLQSLALGGETDWPAALQSADQAHRIFSERVPGAATELVWAEISSQRALSWMLELREKRRRLRSMLRSAEERGDHLSTVIHGVDSLPTVLLGEDRPDDALRTLDEAFGSWTPTGFQVPHLAAKLTRVRILLYQGKGLEAYAYFQRTWTRLLSTMLMRVASFGLETSHLSSAAALMAARDQPAGSRARKGAVRVAKRFAVRSERMGLVCSEGMSQLIWGGVAHVTGDDEAAVHHLENAARALARAGLVNLAYLADRSRGQLLGGDTGTELVARAELALDAAGVQNPERMALLQVPGFGSL